MSNLLFLTIGLFLGAVIMYIITRSLLLDNKDIINDYKKGIDIHNKRELRLIFINHSIKEYVNQELKILKKEYKDKNEEYLAAIRYVAFKDIERKINDLEKDSDTSINNKN